MKKPPDLYVIFTGCGRTASEALTNMKIESHRWAQALQDHDPAEFYLTYVDLKIETFKKSWWRTEFVAFATVKRIYK